MLTSRFSVEVMKQRARGFIILTFLASLGLSAMQTGFRGVWFRAAPMPSARQEISTAVINGRIFVIGGFDSAGASTSTVEVYDPTTNSWSSAAPIPMATNHNAAAVAAGKLYAFGGTSNRVFLYNPGPNTWTDLVPTRFMHGNIPVVAVI